MSRSRPSPLRLVFARSRSVIALTLMAACALPAATASGHRGNPNYRSQITHWSQEYGGLFAEVEERDDSLSLHNRTGNVVVVFGYRGEPYLRFLESGVVQVNRNSPATYLNEDRFAQDVSVPASATPKARPRWEAVASGGKYSWHDHRIHYMGKGVPAQVEDPGERTKVFGWKVPIEVGPQRETIFGTLTWVGRPGAGSGDDGGSSVLPIVLGAAAVLLAGAAILVIVRRRRQTGAASSEAW